MKKELEELELICPLHLDLIFDGYGEFPDGYKLTEEGVEAILKIINDKN